MLYTLPAQRAGRLLNRVPVVSAIGDGPGLCGQRTVKMAGDHRDPERSDLFKETAEAEITRLNQVCRDGARSGQSFWVSA